MSIQGYCWPISVAPGESIAFMVSGDGWGKTTFARHRSVSNHVESLVVGERTFVATPQTVPKEPWRSGCGWTETFREPVPDHWRSGIYSATCVDRTGDQCTVTFVARPKPSRRSRLAVLANVNTWLAYNTWGGRSKYEGAPRMSFLMSNPYASPHDNLHLARAESWVLGWLERERFQYDVITDIDLHNFGLDARQYRCLVLSTHPNTGQRTSTTIFRRIWPQAGVSCTWVVTRSTRQWNTKKTRLPRSFFSASTEDAASPLHSGCSTHPGMNAKSWAWRQSARGCRAEHMLLRADDPATGRSRAQECAMEIGSVKRVSTLRVSVPADKPMVSTTARRALGRLTPAMGSTPSIPHPCPPPSETRHQPVSRHIDTKGLVFSVGSITFGGSLVVDRVISRIVRNVLTRIGLSELFLAWKGGGDDPRLFYNSSPDGAQWTDQVQVGGTSSHSPTLASFPIN
jgi:hypothetical protein